MSRQVGLIEPCGCKWDDQAFPIDLCDLHCPPFDPGVPYDEHMADVMGGLESERSGDASGTDS